MPFLYYLYNTIDIGIYVFYNCIREVIQRGENMIYFDHMVRTTDNFKLRADGIELKQGHIVGVFGRNGAGKSTLFACICQLKRIQLGKIYYKNEPLQVQHKSEICMTLNQYLPLKISIKDIGKKFTQIYPTFRYDFYLACCEKLQLDIHMRLEEGSKGVQQKVSNLLALCSGCSVICLDEPFGGLDPYARAVFQQLILECADENNLILIASHQISELELLVDSFLFLDKGESAFVEDLDTMREIAAKNLKQIVKEVEHEAAER